MLYLQQATGGLLGRRGCKEGAVAMSHAKVPLQGIVAFAWGACRVREPGCEDSNLTPLPFGPPASTPHWLKPTRGQNPMDPPRDTESLTSPSSQAPPSPPPPQRTRKATSCLKYWQTLIWHSVLLRTFDGGCKF